MDKALRPRMFASDTEVGDSRRQWLHLHKSFTTYVGQIENVTEANKLNLYEYEYLQ